MSKIKCPQCESIGYFHYGAGQVECVRCGFEYEVNEVDIVKQEGR